MKGFSKIIYIEKAYSTNDFLKNFYNENKNECSKHDMVCAYTFEQTNGRGRNNKSYSCSKGGLYISLLRKKAQDDVLITLKSCLRILKILEKFFNIELRIKWINDILFSEKKCVGILCESISDDYCIIGIGINVYNKLPDDLQDVAISILDGEKMQKQVLDELVTHIVTEFTAPFAEDWLEEYTNKNIVLGRECILIDNEGNKITSGIVVGFCEDGSIKISNSEGIASYNSGELKFSLRMI